MKKLFLFVFLLFAAGCSTEKPASDFSPRKAVAEEKDENLLKKLEESNTKIQRLTEELEKMRVIQVPVLREPKYTDPFLTKDPAVYLGRMDQDLDDVERGENPVGSFSDWFAINAAEAAKNGASKKEIDARVERLIRLAKEGKPLSTFVITLMDDGGPAAIREYVNSAIRE